MAPTAQDSKPKDRFSTADNAAYEIRKAYNCVIETGVSYFWDRKAIPGVNADEVITLYKHSFECYQLGKHLAADRWARSAKHLARAFWHEAKIHFLEPRVEELPFLEGANDEELDLHEDKNTTTDLLESSAQNIPPSLQETTENMRRYLNRGQRHLHMLEIPDYRNVLLRAERIKAAHEYGRVIECMILACEAESAEKSAA